ncbi:MAG: hypothetical protein PHI49_11980 [Halothiobacillaceae bacterium]|nr:hypothetical protein [Halothiobacillaceae bacterium]
MFKKTRIALTLSAGMAALLISTGVLADENLLGYTVGAETLPKGASEAYLWMTHHGNKRRGSYNMQAIRAEYEYGFTDRLTGAIYFNGYRHDYDCGDTGCAGPEDDGEIFGSRNQFKFSGVSLEMKKMVLSPYKDDLGVALYGEVTYDSIDSITGEKGQGWEVESKVIFQKPYLDGQLQWLTNIELEAESWKPNDGGGTEYAMAPRLRSGVSYRFAPKWFIGFEGWVDAEILKPAEASWEFDHWDLFAGPSLHYGDKRWWATLTFAPQLAGSDESRDNSTGRHLADHERYEVRLKIGYNF